jgi:trehalose 6-phosphate synthase/phosphatase
VALLVDYDGTLVPITYTPELAAPTPQLTAWLRSIADHPRIDFHLVTGRPMAVVDGWFPGEAPVNLWAEHGIAFRSAGERGWHLTLPVTTDWIAAVDPILEAATARTAGASIERKTHSRVWHYRLVEPSLAADRLQELRHTLREAVGAAPVDFLDGKKMLEIRPHGVSKALVVLHVLGATRPHDTIVAIGDDRTDEDMFAALPPSGIAVHVGEGPTSAPYHLDDDGAVRRFLAQVAGVEPLDSFRR